MWMFTALLYLGFLILGLIFLCGYLLPVDDSDILIFHPNADLGGGGEKCCWALIMGLLKSKRPLKIGLFIRKNCIIGPRELSRTAGKTFQLSFGDDLYPRIKIAEPSLAEMSDTVTLKLIPLRTFWTSVYQYPKVCRMGQLLGGLLCGLEAVITTWRSVKSPVVLDTIGCAPAMFAMRILTRRKCRAYIHWPFIDDMVMKRNGKASLSWCYDAAVLAMYKEFGRIAYESPVVCNSTYTHTRIRNLWKKETQIEFPPVDEPPARKQCSKPIAMSVAQFRPEKNHRRQIDIIRHTILNVRDE